MQTKSCFNVFEPLLTYREIYMQCDLKIGERNFGGRMHAFVKSILKWLIKTIRLGYREYRLVTLLYECLSLCNNASSYLLICMHNASLSVITPIALD